MNREAEQRAPQMALAHLKAATPLETAAKELVEFARPIIPAHIDLSLVPLCMEPSVEGIVEHLTELFQTDPPAGSINGLWFGLFEMMTEGDDEDADEALDEELDEDVADDALKNEMTLYISGSAKFNPDVRKPDWHCRPDWFPDGRYMQPSLLVHLNELRPQSESEEDFEADFHIVTCLIVPLTLLCVGEAVRRMGPTLLLGTAAYRGIATGLDEGDKLDIGVLRSGGFEPAATL